MNTKNQTKGELAIAYRIYPKVSKTPPIFHDDKYKLSELCLKSFREALGDLKIKMWVLLDNCPNEYKELFKRHFSDEELVFVELAGVGNQETFKRQMQLLSEQDFSDNIYFAEDDYFYLPNTIYEMIELIKMNPMVDFVTPYDHLDYYEHELHDYKSDIIISEKRHWRSGATTCMTFMTTKTKLKKSWSVFWSYTKNNYDTSLWMTLTKTKVLNPFVFIRFLFGNKYLAKIFIKAWLYTPMQNIFGKKCRLYVPVPTLATHLDKEHLAPGVNWEQQFIRVNEK